MVHTKKFKLESIPLKNMRKFECNGENTLTNLQKCLAKKVQISKPLLFHGFIKGEKEF
jgi:hypothetical protein